MENNAAPARTSQRSRFESRCWANVRNEMIGIEGSTSRTARRSKSVSCRLRFRERANGTERNRKRRFEIHARTASKSRRPAPPFQTVVPRCWNDADYFDRLVLLLLSHSALVPTCGACACPTAYLRPHIDALSKRITIRPEFLCQNFVNDRDLRTGLGRLRLSEPRDPESPAIQRLKNNPRPRCSKPPRRQGLRRRSPAWRLKPGWTPARWTFLLRLKHPERND